MLVRNWMSKPVITIDSNDSMQEAMKAMKQHQIPMLPVMKKGQTGRHRQGQGPEKGVRIGCHEPLVHELLFLISKIKVKDIMTKDPVTIPVDYTVEEATEILLKNKISGAPVVDANEQLALAPSPKATCSGSSFLSQVLEKKAFSLLFRLKTNLVP